MLFDKSSAIIMSTPLAVNLVCPSGIRGRANPKINMSMANHLKKLMNSPLRDLDTLVIPLRMETEEYKNAAFCPDLPRKRAINGINKINRSIHGLANFT